ncbi:cytochrome P450 [Nocardia sp. BSTN01]|uniref:cytochrome P450 n=1 Tax=Nocardia sp. BSTN01 TaxID=2783665 RepID=UPI00188E73E0|nr:cytochrome P450 [Nocardia sp. BSTN01]MBF5001807.1 cytochrome P450 [Nocardia sp. BSTN01]
MQHPSVALAGAPPTPIEEVGPRISLFSTEFANNPHAIYQHMRDNYGGSSLIPVLLAPEVPATLVIGWHTARKILVDDEHFPADPRAWQDSMPAGCPIRPMTQWRPNVLHADGAVHTRLRAAINDSLAGIDHHRLRDQVVRIAEALIERFCGEGRADVLTDYAYPLVFSVLNALIGCSAEAGSQVADAMARMFNSTTGTETVEEDLAHALGRVVAGKRIRFGDDITTRLLRFPTEPGEHARLSDNEAIHQLVLLFGAAIEPTVNLLANTVLRMVTDDRFLSSATSSSATIPDALDAELICNPPMANFGTTYPRRPCVVDQPNGQRIWLPANQPVVISIAACNNDPRVNKGDLRAADWHLGWLTGRHACPAGARDAAKLIAGTGIEMLLDAVPDLVPTNPHPVYRPGPFHRALAEFPVTFTKTTPLPARLPADK